MTPIFLGYPTSLVLIIPRVNQTACDMATGLPCETRRLDLRRSVGMALLLVAFVMSGCSGSDKAAAPTTSAPPLMDPCMVGPWRTVKTTLEGFKLTLPTGEVEPVDVTGAGAIFRFMPEGTAVVDFGQSAPLEATVRGKRLSLTLRGSANWSRFTSRDGKVIEVKPVDSPLSASATYGGNRLENVYLKVSEGQPETAPPPGKAPSNSYSCRQDSLSGRWSGLVIGAVRAG